MTRKPRSRSAAATSPVPVATSSTWPPSRGSVATRNRRHRGSWPNERSAPTRSYLGPSGAKSAFAWARRSDTALSWHGGFRRSRRTTSSGPRRLPQGHAGAATLTGILPTEPASGARIYVCAFENGDGDGRGSHSIATGSRSARGGTCATRSRSRPSARSPRRQPFRATSTSYEPSSLRCGSRRCPTGSRRPRTRPGRSSTFSARRRSSPHRRAWMRSGEAARRLERALDPTAPSPFTDTMRSRGRRRRRALARRRVRLPWPAPVA